LCPQGGGIIAQALCLSDGMVALGGEFGDDGFLG